MITLSRREEQDVLDRAKEQSLKHCEALVKDFADCAKGKTVTVLWNCGGQYNTMRQCMKDYLTLERIDAAKADHIANREERNAEALEKAQKKLTQRRT
ncbi:hypothetical protein FFLO_04672 [Filobasidium floriforme]|uniref:COX assembly mitochondrial protein n=1 Tax=Filobasidium floriforme TaxID=5210 RepID=A0A8K0JKG6_9TREE|nr:uncharacterized protein HD553DRAFT_338158 [Filobasidium floriforme]KAG7530944.1 hypothetical protein FFLO_04672 [Filobasidium floriforme]KAH8090470.1 hypothetical protein HD553DRAFT_338158 [Filobasidium floriforme]